MSSPAREFQRFTTAALAIAFNDPNPSAELAARPHADDSAAAAGALEAELITARAAAAECRERATSELDSLLELATQAGLERRTTTLADQLRGGAISAGTWTPLLRELATDWRDVLHRQRELMRELRRAAADAERARAGEREAAGRLEQAATKRAACEEQLEEARAALTSAFEHWRSALVQLELDEQSAGAALELAHAGSSPMPALAAPVDRRRASLADERSSHVAARQAVAGAAAAAEAEIERLASRGSRARTTTGRGLRGGCAPTAASALGRRSGD